MSRKILHIGYPKTGTTSLQILVLSPLSRSGYLQNYIGVSSDKNSPTRIRVLEYLKSARRGQVPAELKRFFLEFVGSPEGFFISQEGLVGVAKQESCQELVTRLMGSFSRDTEIVLTIRPTLQLLTSLYQQKVKTGYTDNYREYFLNNQLGHDGEKFFREKFAKLATDDLVDCLLTYFLKVTVLDLRKDGYLSWLLELTGLNPNDLRLMSIPSASREKMLNPSLSQVGVKVMETLNRSLKLVFPYLSEASPTYKFSKEVHSLERSFTLANVMRLKGGIAKLLIFMGRLTRQKKYELPSNLQRLICESFPESSVAKLVSAGGGIYTFHASSGLNNAHIQQA